MRVVVQEVKYASVTVDNVKIASINRGFLLFVGFDSSDDENILPKMADKIVKLRIFPDENRKTNLSLKDVDGEILSVSQFTLYASLKDGNRPSFVNAMRPEFAKPLFDKWNEILKERFNKLQTGIFGADMKVELLNDGPFTLILDSRELFK